MNIDVIIEQIEVIMDHYRETKMYGELFGLKVALDILKRERSKYHETVYHNSGI